LTREKGKNTAASIRERLLTLAHSKGEDYQRVLGRYAVERFLYRLGQLERAVACAADLGNPRVLERSSALRDNLTIIGAPL
jgi:hypothetical protein